MWLRIVECDKFDKREKLIHVDVAIIIRESYSKVIIVENSC